MSRRRAARGVAAVLAVAGLAAACAGPAPMLQPVDAGAPTDPGQQGSATPQPSDDALAEFYTQVPSWYACGGGFECADVEVPLDYDAPDGERVQLAVKRLPADDPAARQGSLLVNPGGPGASGLDLVDSAADLFSNRVLDAYDVVGFDPRGVGSSTKIVCLGPDEEDPSGGDYDLSDDAEVQRLVDDLDALGEMCRDHSGDLLDHVDTVHAARDLDVLRAVLGDERLTYLGFSYGTILGATFAELFPDRVGRLVLDGAIDPSIDYTQMTADQVDGFEVAFRSYLANCLEGDACPFSGTEDEAYDRAVAFLEELDAEPLPSEGEDGELTSDEAYGAIQSSMYVAWAWEALSEGFTQAFEDADGSALDVIAHENDDPDPNADFAFWGIDCSDYPITSSVDEILAQADELEEASALFGAAMGTGELVCRQWPYQSTAVREPIEAAGAAPILVVGTTRDPATPYRWAEALAGQLESGRLLTWDGDGHTAYASGSPCIDEAVQAYLLDGTLPDDGTVC
ncbi:alpha/beta hydrolase [Beutenbergia cavernae]|uniref:alpha/beta hydrolase n=1 Tax=Beutenbergia cavernae TaxID=84757 RepID=UPI0005BC5AFC|nr:alpha/beta hydrolase [Beutenbergia cavernae]